ncbi:cyclic dehypoxanthine futalosine synthase [Dissulfurispira thermophila]|uniref:Cyclic dehypoxanthine futalosine synthase n=2 Tax=root TaxID=1 RepID=A0A7G1GZ78_9BACT|nr:cyclic dehypoxanthinyl futalosine synthase [Dissulfurispira thermophila]BCB95372.1 cyclic dehypoxanthine futalosine synthase [Dissulfurispira thermophila]
MNRIDKQTALKLLKNSDLLELGERADNIRKNLHPEGVVTFIVDRNINYTNVCINKCKFCAFYRDVESPDAYLLDKDEIFKKIDETIALGGTQILLQGGIHPELGLDYYTDLLKSIKERYSINIHGFSPPEITYLSERHNLTIRETLVILRQAGLDSIPGGGAEILSDRVREILSPNKIKSSQWLRVMEEAHKIGMRTTATMMFGSVEEPEDIIEHLDAIRKLQDKTRGFTAFIPWSFQPKNTEIGSLFTAHGSRFCGATAVDYLRVLALSRIYLDNVKNIQASWVTQGLKMAQVALRFGANDFGSTMIEENVVRATGVSYTVSKEDIIQAIKSAEFKAAQRDTYYNLIKEF